MRTPLAFLRLFLCLPICCCALAQGYHKLQFDKQGNASAGAETFWLTGPDNAAQPELWQGPITIAHGSAKCEADLSLVKDVYVDEANGKMVAVTISGSNTYVSFVDILTCAKRPDKIKAFTEGVSVTGHRLTILPACTPSGRGDVSQCSAAMVYKLSAAGSPTLLQADSDALTRKLVGLSFRGFSKVSQAKTQRAHLAGTPSDR